MKTVARVFIVLACLAILVVVGYAVSSRLSLSGRISAEPAADKEAVYAVLKEQVESGEYEGISKLSGAEGYHFVTFRVNIKNYSPFRAEWVTLCVESADGARIIDKDTQLKPGEAPVSLEDGDLLVCEKNAWLRQIDAFGKLEGDDCMYVTLLSSTRDPALRATLEYYIFGRYHSLEIPLSR